MMTEDIEKIHASGKEVLQAESGFVILGHKDDYEGVMVIADSYEGTKATETWTFVEECNVDEVRMRYYYKKHTTPSAFPPDNPYQSIQ
jgi:hypothetical protein